MKAFRLFRLFGIEVRLDWSLILIFGLITANLAGGLFPSWHPEWSPAVSWGTAAAAALLFLLSVLVHELAHALTGRLFGTEIRSITLFLFGGVAGMRGEPRSAGAEFAIALAGPLASFAIGLAASFGAVATPVDLEQGLRHAGPIGTLLAWLGPVNIGLALFNLVPGFPLDGGRILRSLLWAVTGDFVRATRWASIGGQIVGGLMMAFGVVEALGGAIGPGIWLALIGWFLMSAARASLSQVLVKQALADVPVTQLMRMSFERVPPDLSLGVLVRDFVMQTEQRAWPVERDGALLGLVTFENVRKVPAQLWEQTAIHEVMTPREKLVAVGDGQSGEVALDLMAKHDVDQLPVVRGGRLVGLVRRADLLKWFALQPRAAPPGRLRYQ